MIDDRAETLPDCPALFTSLLGFDAPAGGTRTVNVLVELAVSMRAHGRGGMMLMVPSGTDIWRESIVQPIPYAISPTFNGLADLCSARTPSAACATGRTSMDETVRAVAGLTAVDGATLITDRYELLAFGAKIARRDGSPLVEQTAVTEPIEGGEARRAFTRRDSAARATCRPRSSCTTSATPSRSWRRRTAASRSSRGRRASRWCTRTAWRRSSSELRIL